MLKTDLQKVSALLNSKTRNTRTRINLFRVEARRNNNKFSRYLRLLSRVLDLKLRKLNDENKPGNGVDSAPRPKHKLNQYIDPDTLNQDF